METWMYSGKSKCAASPKCKYPKYTRKAELTSVYITYNIKRVDKMADVRTRVRWERKTPKKQEDGRGIKANAVVSEAEQEEPQKPTRNKTKFRGTWIVCRLQIQSHCWIWKAEGTEAYVLNTTHWLIIYTGQAMQQKTIVILVFQSSSFLCSSSPLKTFLWQFCINGLP